CFLVFSQCLLIIFLLEENLRSADESPHVFGRQVNGFGKIVTRLLVSLEREIGKTTTLIKCRLLIVCQNRSCKLHHRLVVLLAVKQLEALCVLARPASGRFLFGGRFLLGWCKAGHAEQADGNQKRCDSTGKHDRCVLLPTHFFSDFSLVGQQINTSKKE